MASTTTRPQIPAGLVAGGVVAIARRLSADAAPAVAGALAERRRPRLRDHPQRAQGRRVPGHRGRRGTWRADIAIGAGTVLSIEDAGPRWTRGRLPRDAHHDTELVAWAAARGIPAFPGAATPTEIHAAWRAGAAAVKLFPASALGPSFVRECRGPFPDIPLVPTGGVTAETAGAFITAGAIAVGLGELARR